MVEKTDNFLQNDSENFSSRVLLKKLFFKIFCRNEMKTTREKCFGDEENESLNPFVFGWRNSTQKSFSTRKKWRFKELRKFFSAFIQCKTFKCNKKELLKAFSYFWYDLNLNNYSFKVRKEFLAMPFGIGGKKNPRSFRNKRKTVLKNVIPTRDYVATYPRCLNGSSCEINRFW